MRYAMKTNFYKARLPYQIVIFLFFTTMKRGEYPGEKVDVTPRKRVRWKCLTWRHMLAFGNRSDAQKSFGMFWK